MQLYKAERKKARIKMALQGPSGSGKTMSALLIAFGLCGEWNKIAVIDTENHSADLYAHLGGYNELSVSSPFTPEKYIEAITVCENAGIEVIIIDSISHEWEGIGGICLRRKKFLSLQASFS
jgi:AAA domain